MGKQKAIEWFVTDKGCFECTSHAKTSDGYSRIMHNGKQTRVHVKVYEEMFGFIQNGMVVRHKCDNPKCINPEHLELGTPKQNSEDMVKRNRQHSKISKDDAIYIKNSTLPRKELAKMFSIDLSMICRIKNGKKWCHI